ncbi:MFS transporter [Pseudarthrobacter sp. N5]|uniref:MFS transporter n=1 Tax=Pseudarthrobacter sp. N5 TaxID=3418416 RepID=UPI003CE9B482
MRSRPWDSTPLGYGVLLAISALGGLSGSFLAAPLRSLVGYAWTIMGSLALGCSTLIGLSFTQVPWAAAFLLAAYVLHAEVWGICVSSIRQRLVPEHLRGRVNASSKVLGLIGLTLGAMLGGVLAGRFGLPAPFLAGGLILGVCVVIAGRIFRRSALEVERIADGASARQPSAGRSEDAGGTCAEEFGHP